MSWLVRLLLLPCVTILCCLPNLTLQAQQVRRLAPGVLRVIPPEPQEEETFHGPITIEPLTQLNWTPNYTPETQTVRQKASRVVVRQNVWNLEFSFKPLRMVHVDIPQPNGKMQRKLVWYLVYRLRNLGNHLAPVPVEDEFRNRTYEAQRADEVLNVGAAQPEATVRFYPKFILETRREQKEYLDRLIPVAMPVIARRETGGQPLHNSVEISRMPIPVGRDETDGIWGVATWKDVDPRIDFFSILVQGLTNAFRIAETSEDGQVYQHKTLQLNFWRPGDTHNEHEREIRFGIPAVSREEEQRHILSQYGIEQRLDHLWVYR